MFVHEENVPADSWGGAWHCVDVERKDIWTENRPPERGRSARDQGDGPSHDRDRAAGPP